MLKKEDEIFRNITNIIFNKIKIMTLETNIVLKDFIGNKTIASNLIKSFNHSNYCGAWLLKGPEGCWKS